jgi:ribulose bisphosphate carboxylase small subunit
VALFVLVPNADKLKLKIFTTNHKVKTKGYVLYSLVSSCLSERLRDLLFLVCLDSKKKEVITAGIWQKPDENHTLIRRGERDYVR